MSLFEKFSVSYGIEQAKKRKKEFLTASMKPEIFNDNGSRKDVLTEEIIENLLSYGYNISQIMTAYKIYKFSTLDEAIFFLMRDPESKKFNHRFYVNEVNKESIQGLNGFRIAKESLCFFCNEKIDDHIENYLSEQFEENNKINFEEIKDTSFNLDRSNNILNNPEKGPFEKNSVLKLKIFKNIEISKENLDMFDNPDVCSICFDEVLEEGNSFKFACGHRFCRKCISNHLNVNINTGKVMLIMCLYGGCPKLFSDEEVKILVTEEAFVKYKKYKVAQLRLANHNTNYINCPYPDCEDLMESPQDVKDSMVQCEFGHKFCTRCKTIGWHKIGKCKKDENSVLKKLQRDINGINYKQCPKCSIIIEKIEGCNQMRCINCDFEFCWLCLKAFSQDHYSMYNFLGCPGLRFESPEEKSFLNNKLLKCLWFMCSIISGILAFVGVIIFFLFFGCAYEFVKYYLNKHYEEDEERGIYQTNQFKDPENNQTNIEGEESNCSKNSIIALLIFIGICCQPLYLVFYLIYALMEFSKRFGCWFYYSNM